MGPDGLPRLIADWEDKSAAALCLFGYCEVGERESTFYELAVFICRIVNTRAVAVDPPSIFADLDPAVFLDADSDPAAFFNLDPDQP